MLVGQRRCGKSYILRQIIQQLINNKIKPQNILYINLEFTDFDFLQTYKDLADLINLYEKKQNPQGKIYLLIDEIQNIDAWEKTINSYSQDYTKDYEIFITGSNSELLSGELSTFLSGRYIEFKIYPFSLKVPLVFLALRFSHRVYAKIS